MKIVMLIIAAFWGVLSFLNFFYAYKNSSKIFQGEVRSSSLNLKTAFQFGLGAGMLFFALSLSFTEDYFDLTLSQLFVSLILSTLIGFVVFIVTNIRFLIVGKFRQVVYKKISDKIRQDNSK